MKNLKFTKGEWEINKQASNTVQIKGTNRSIASTGGYSTNGIDTDTIFEENKANAKLISAAPELLEALIELNDEVIKMCSIGSDPLFMDMLIKSQKSFDAIRKVTK